MKTEETTLKIPDMFNRRVKFQANNPEQIKLKYELFEWIADAGLPYTIGKLFT